MKPLTPRPPETETRRRRGPRVASTRALALSLCLGLWPALACDSDVQPLGPDGSARPDVEAAPDVSAERPDAGAAPDAAPPPLDAGSAPDASTTVPVDEETDTIRAEPGLRVRFTTLEAPALPAGTTPLRALIRTPSEFQAAFGVAPDPALGLGDRWIVAYDAGDAAQPTDRALIARVRLRGSRLDITTSLRAVSAECVGEAFARRSVAVIFEARLLRDRVGEVRFLRADRALSCPEREARQARITSATEYADWLDGTRGTFTDVLVDRAALGRSVTRRLLDGDDPSLDWVTAMRETLLAFPSGHAGFYAVVPGSVPGMYGSLVGVCARPYGDGFVITRVAPGRAIDLDAGDLVIAVDNEEGEAMRRTALRRPVAATGSATEAHRRMAAALATFAAPEPGTELLVRAPSGAVRTVVVPQAASTFLDCRGPLTADRSSRPRVTRRPDGVAVIRVPSFYVADPGQTDLEAVRATTRAAIREAFEQARDAPAIVWDVRANFGGLTLQGLEIVQGMPSARPTPIATCEYRPDGTSELVRDDFIDYRVVPGGDLAYPGRVAVVADALALSATDYFLYAVAAATDVPIVGTGASGGYGTAFPSRRFVGPPDLEASGDAYRCLDTLGMPLEGREVRPNVFVELAPDDLAQGRDTQLEAAAALVR